LVGLDDDVFLGLDRLVQAFRQPAALHHAARELVDQDHLAGADDVVLVAGVEHVGAQRLVDVVHHRDVGGVVEARRILRQVAAGRQDLLDPLGAFLGQDDLALLLVVLEGGRVLDQLFDDLVDGLVELGAVLGGPADDQRRARLVDQDRVHLVDDGEVVAALDHLDRLVDQVVAQVVEAELVVGAVGDVGVIGRLPLALGEAVDDRAHLQAQEAVDLAHPLGVALGQVVVDRDDVDALALESVEVDRQGRHQRLAFAGAHLGDAALVQNHAADHLHVEVPQPDRPARGLPHHGEGLLQQVVQGRALGQPGLELLGLAAQLCVGQGRKLRLMGVDLADPGLQGLDLAVVGRAEEPLEDAQGRGPVDCGAAGLAGPFGSSPAGGTRLLRAAET
jgi:hypothetical protein